MVYYNTFLKKCTIPLKNSYFLSKFHLFDPYFLIMKNKFILCGTIGWCLEILYTGFYSFCKKDFRLTAKTSIWMFPIYGLACFILPLQKLLKGVHPCLRGIIYTCFIFLVEFLSGSFLKRKNFCPWDYSKAKFNFKGVIRLDYAPLWFGMGLLFERILRKL